MVPGFFVLPYQDVSIRNGKLMVRREVERGPVEV
jgi:hypothetical protein